MRERATRINPKKTIELLKRVRELGLTEVEFRSIHHLGGSMNGFEHYCGTVKTFRIDSGNHRLHKVLQKLLEETEAKQKVKPAGDK
jgi:hypothetical protein